MGDFGPSQPLENVSQPSHPIVDMRSKSDQLLVVERAEQDELLWLLGLVLESYPKDG